jgi:hypothetical protein
MKKFLKEYSKVLEQDEGFAIDEEPTEVEAEPTPEVEPEVEPEVQPLSPESEVLLIRLLKKALVTEIDPNDVDTLSGLGDINEKNAKSSLKTLINIMKKYSTEVDIET